MTHRIGTPAATAVLLSPGTLREITGDDFSAKDFRTWADTVIAIEALSECRPSKTERQAKKNIADAVEKVAGRLGNTAAVSKKCYIHPAVFQAYAARTPPQRNSEKGFVRRLRNGPSRHAS